MKRNTRKLIAQIVLVLIVLGVGIGISAVFLLTKSVPRKEYSKPQGPLVEVTSVRKSKEHILIHGNGTVAATQTSKIVPQVGGKVESVHKNFVTGGYIRSGEPLIRIEKSDYELARRSAEAQVLQAEASRATAEAQVNEAIIRVKDAQDDLAQKTDLEKRGVTTERELKKAQIAYELANAQLSVARTRLTAAEAQLSTAKLGIEQAQLRLDRTEVTLPFDAVVVSENVDAGQFVVEGQSLGEVYATDAVEIPVPLEDRELQWFDSIPVANLLDKDPKLREKLPRADVGAVFLGKRQKWSGQVVRTEAKVDPNSQMISVIVRVDLSFTGLEKDSAPLIPGTFVDVTIYGRELDGVFVLPRRAVRPGDQVWIVRDGTLRKQRVRVVRRERDRVLIESGIESDDTVITSSLDVATEGMAVRIPEDSNTSTTKTAKANE